MIVDQAGRQIQARTEILEFADQFAFFGIDPDANDGETAALKSVVKIAEVEELMVVIGTGVGGEVLVIEAKGIAYLMEEEGNGTRLTRTPKSLSPMAILAVVRRDHFSDP